MHVADSSTLPVKMVSLALRLGCCAGLGHVSEPLGWDNRLSLPVICPVPLSATLYAGLSRISSCSPNTPGHDFCVKCDYRKAQRYHPEAEHGQKSEHTACYEQYSDDAT
jgi:hypothetical protein